MSSTSPYWVIAVDSLFLMTTMPIANNWTNWIGCYFSLGRREGLGIDKREKTNKRTQTHTKKLLFLAYFLHVHFGWAKGVPPVPTHHYPRLFLLWTFHELTMRTVSFYARVKKSLVQAPQEKKNDKWQTNRKEKKEERTDILLHHWPELVTHGHSRIPYTNAHRLTLLRTYIFPVFLNARLFFFS